LSQGCSNKFIWFPSNWLKTKKLAIYHSSGPWKSALKSFRQDEKTSLKKRNLQHPEIGLHPINPLALKYSTPPLPLEKQIKRYHTPVTKSTLADLAGFSHTTRSPCGLAHWDAALGSSIYPPHRLLAASAWSPSQAAR